MDLRSENEVSKLNLALAFTCVTQLRASSHSKAQSLKKKGGGNKINKNNGSMAQVQRSEDSLQESAG